VTAPRRRWLRPEVAVLGIWLGACENPGPDPRVGRSLTLELPITLQEQPCLELFLREGPEGFSLRVTNRGSQDLPSFSDLPGTIPASPDMANIPKPPNGRNNSAWSG
jgi:hypothetical protein